MPTTEPTINDALAEVLRATRSLWRGTGVVLSENTNVLRDAGKRPDILVLEPNVSPVVIETEVLPASTVEKDAVERLGQRVAATGRPLLSSLAIRMPTRLRNLSGTALRNELSNAADFQVAMFTGRSAEQAIRWPRKGWLGGTALDISVLAQSAAIPPEIIEETANMLINGVMEAAGVLEEIGRQHPGAIDQICKELRQENGTQTQRMAVTILVNALVFQETLAHGPERLSEVKTRSELSHDRSINKTAILAEWDKILKVNYWPIFDIARRILHPLPADDAMRLMQKLGDTADKLIEARLMRSHDLTGAMFQQLISDRKFLAAFYTRPESAALLASLALLPDRTPGNKSWAKPEDVVRLRIADFACGTGTLLSTAYRLISQYHEAAGGDAELLHPAMMASVLIGCDVLPAAAHLTASMLAGAHPTVFYKDTSVLAVEYGRQPGGRAALGALDLLTRQGAFDVLGMTGRLTPVTGGRALEATGESSRNIRLELPDDSFDLVLMNPPFTRDTGQEAGKLGVPNPMFAAFETPKEEQRAMAQAMAKLLKGSSYHGNAGEASAFLVLADRKVKLDGTLALVMPLSLLLGEAWDATRNLLHRHYENLVCVSLAGALDRDLSFSADTDMGECLITGQKTGRESKRATFVVLNERPQSQIEATTAARQIRQAIQSGPRRLEDGPFGGTPLYFGDEVIGWALDAPLPNAGSWKLARIKDAALAQVAYQLTANGLVWLPGAPRESAPPISIASLGRLWVHGPIYHMDINADTPTGGIRGPFQIQPLEHGQVPTYPVLWSHDADRERTLQFEPDSEGIVRQGADSKAQAVWATASHCHVNRDFRFNSQSTAMQFTTRKTIGGRAWPSVTLAMPEQEQALTLWGNSTLGLLLHWWHANKQQSGRGSIGVTSLRSLPVLDVTALSTMALNGAVKIFEDMKLRPMRPINEIADDPVRHELDERLANSVLGLPPEFVSRDGPLDMLRRKLAAEPSITGGKLGTVGTRADGG